MTIQIPPAVGSSGQFIETAVVTSSQNRHVMVVGDGVSTAFAPATSSGGLLISVSNPSTAVTVTNPTTAVTITNPTTQVSIAGTVPIVSASSGLIQISGTPTIVSASSGLIQLTSSPLVVAASSAGHQVGSLTSGIVSPSSNWTVVSTATTLTSGTVTLSSVHTVTATAATNPWTSAPGFNVPVVSASSGLVQISGTVTVFNTSSGIVQAIVTGSSGVGAVVTSSGALLVSGTPGSVSTAVNLLTSGGAFYPVTTSYGVLHQPFGSLSSTRLVIATSVSKISSAPGVLTFLSAITTAIALDGRYLRLYDQTTGNATSSTNSGLAGACALFRIVSSVAATPLNLNTIDLGHGVKFGTACSFDLVVAATSTAANATGGWVTAQYTS